MSIDHNDLAGAAAGSALSRRRWLQTAAGLGVLAAGSAVLSGQAQAAELPTQAADAAAAALLAAQGAPVVAALTLYGVGAGAIAADVYAFRFDSARPLGASAPQFAPLVITKPVDAATPALAAWVAGGKTAEAAVLDVFADGAVVASLTLSGLRPQRAEVHSDGDAPVETLTFGFAKLQWSLAASGAAYGWDLQKGAPV